MSLRHQPPTATFSLLSINNVQPSSLFALSFPSLSFSFPRSLFFLQPSYNPSSLSTLPKSSIYIPYPLLSSTRFPINEGKFVARSRESLDYFESTIPIRREGSQSIQRFVRILRHLRIQFLLSTTIRLIMVRAIIPFPTAEIVLHR